MLLLGRFTGVGARRLFSMNAMRPMRSAMPMAWRRSGNVGLKTAFMGLPFAAPFSVSMLTPSRTIYNDTAVDIGANVLKQTGLSQAEVEVVKGERKVRLDYRGLCLGSILGVGAGVIIGKISGVLAYFTVFAFLVLQWMKNRGLIDKNSSQLRGLYRVAKVGFVDEEGNARFVNSENLCFKLSFLLTFLLAAVNTQ